MATMYVTQLLPRDKWGHTKGVENAKYLRTSSHVLHVQPAGKKTKDLL